EHPIFPFFTSVKVSVLLQSDSPYTCEIVLMYESNSIPIAREIGGTAKNIENQGGVGVYKQITITAMISPEAASEDFTISLKLRNTGAGIITVSHRRVDVVYSLFGLVLPGLIILIGLVLTVVSFVIGKKSSPRTRKRATPGGWEPTLQWSGGSGASKSKNSSSKKRSKMAISSIKGKSGKKTKIVKRSVPQGGAQVGCKFCGKQVAQSAFFCPHCYGKLR
ncbi:MAG: zinc ribbon domain-containing protein, partial [Candidatus Heimdallarchaeota archaeon]|nr:zinc ribbon domain-containing protein [Candidatus Heimdallarchaeota archaeon]